MVSLTLIVKEYANLDQLNKFEDGTEVTPALLVETGVVKNEKSGIKVLGNGSLDKKLTVKAHKFSASAVEAIDAKVEHTRDLMFQTQSFFKTKEVRNKIFFTLAMLVIFKIGTYIPAPGVNPEPFEQQGSDQGVAALLNTFGGGALKNFQYLLWASCPTSRIYRNAITTNGYCSEIL